MARASEGVKNGQSHAKTPILSRLQSYKGFREIQLGWLRFPSENLIRPILAFFHTTMDMMTVILRIDAKSDSNLRPES